MAGPLQEPADCGHPDTVEELTTQNPHEAPDHEAVGDQLADRDRYLGAASETAGRRPGQRPQNAAAVEWIAGQEIEATQEQVDHREVGSDRCG